MSKHDQKTRHVGLAHVAQPLYLALTNFGEVSTRATIRCCVRAGGLSGLPSSSDRSGGRGATALPVIRGFALALGDDAAKMAALHRVATSATPPVVSGRWRVGLRRAIASRRAIPADVKDQSYHPLHPSSHGEYVKVYPNPLPVSSGKCVFAIARGVQGLTGDLRQETRDMRQETG